MSRDKNSEFDRQLAGKFDNFQPEVPDGLWQKIASKLDEQEQGNAIPIKQRRRLPTSWMSVAASILIASGIVLWYNRPVTVTYLQNPVTQVDVAEIPVAEEPAHEPVPIVEPLDIDRLKQLFNKRDRPPKHEIQRQMLAVETPYNDLLADAADKPVISEVPVSSKQVLAQNDGPSLLSVNQPVIDEAVAANVPEIQPPVALEDEEETLLAATEDLKAPFGISNILNYVVEAVDQRDEKLVTFSNDGEGSLRLDFNFSLAKNKKKRIK